MGKAALNTLKGHLASLGAYSIFGMNIIFCKDMVGAIGLSPLAIFTLRAAGASALFWLASLFLPREKVRREDFPKIAAASLIGFVAIPQSLPVDTAVVGTLSPVFTMLFAALFVKEPITGKKVAGVAVSLAGILFVIRSSHYAAGAVDKTTTAGWILLFLNAASFAAYLGIFRPLASRYHVVTFMKWIFLFALVAVFPFTAREIVTFDFTAVPPKLLWELAYLVVLATFVAYFLIPVGQKHIRPTLVSLYSYVQPIITAVVGIAAGTDVLSWPKAVAILLVLAGVTLVNASRAKDA